ncbi:hypothetical protein MLD38_023334 [Melastoma candidum]|uniref:Uncharacterized protein n=1 Tax=Melastoma candidum TaxID=119954 RepID=A0ACB9QLH9_9MYRT|nr:hypothetical protein MLD38_023334 [Melastoma candidum]
MFNSEHDGYYASSHQMGPRISFSHDFVDTQQQAVAFNHEASYKEAPVSTDFQFSVRDHTMIPADEIFCQGKMLPLRNKCSENGGLRKMTLREELLAEDDLEDSPRFTNSPGRWRDRWSLKRGNFGSKRGDKSEVCLESVLEEKASIFTMTSKK